MTDHRKKKDRGEPAVEFRWDPLVLASDRTFSTTIRIQVSGWWPERRPKEVALSVYERGQEPPAGDAVRIQNGHGTFPLTGLEPGHHYHMVVYIEDRTPVQNMIAVPELPKPKKPEEEELEREQTELARAKVARELREVTQKKPRDPKQISVTILGERGRQKLLISVSADDGSLIPGFTGSVQDGSTLVTYTTGDNGTAVYETDFHESSRPFEIRAGNHSDLVWRGRLLGPKTES